MSKPTYGVKLIDNVLHILREKSIRNNNAPNEHEVAIAIDYIGGKKAKLIMQETGESLEGILVALKRTRDEIRRGNAPVQVLHRFPKLVAWQAEKFHLDDRTNGHAKPEPAKPDDIFTTPPGEIAKHSAENALSRAGVKITTEVRKQIQEISTFKYTDPDPEDPETFKKFMSEVRTNVMRVVAPLAGQVLAAELAGGGAMTTGLEVAGLLPKGKGLTIAQQFNMGGASDDKHKRLRSGLGFERLLDKADAVIDAEVVK
jgi:hypothetical protein